MMQFFIRTLVLFFIVLLTPVMAATAVPEWNIVPVVSTLKITATQNESPVTGEFKTFTGEIHFDPAMLNASSVRIVVDIGSVETSYKEVGETLKTQEWFDAKMFPQAIFLANHFTKVNGNTYRANGTLTIRDKMLPVVLIFVLDQYSQKTAHVTGSVTIRRTLFGVGRGDWANTTEVKDDVKVDFVISAVRK